MFRRKENRKIKPAVFRKTDFNILQKLQDTASWKANQGGNLLKILSWNGKNMESGILYIPHFVFEHFPHPEVFHTNLDLPCCIFVCFSCLVIPT